MTNNITEISAANPTVIKSDAHGLANGTNILISGSNSTPTIDGQQIVSNVTPDTFTVPVAVTTAGTEGTWALGPVIQPVLGLVLDINGTPVTINAGTITEFQTKGIELGITNPVDLGEIGAMIDYINKTFSINIPTQNSTPSISALPSPLNEILLKVEGLDVTIVKAHVKLPPTQHSDGTAITPALPILYTLVMSVLEAGTDDILKIGPLGLKGAVIGVTNETQAPAASTPAALPAS